MWTVAPINEGQSCLSCGTISKGITLVNLLLKKCDNKDLHFGLIVIVLYKNLGQHFPSLMWVRRTRGVTELPLCRGNDS